MSLWQRYRAWCLGHSNRFWSFLYGAAGGFFIFCVVPDYYNSRPWWWITMLSIAVVYCFAFATFFWWLERSENQIVERTPPRS